MNQEIERKFLVARPDYKKLYTTKTTIQQGYLSRVPERTVRVRVADNSAWITIKGISDAAGLTRNEWEFEIPAEDGRALLALCVPPIIHKTRYCVPYGSFTLEIDEFEAPKKMTLAEVELPETTTPFEPPSWLGKEVTGDPQYYNANL
jgi:adenylate cyclase